MRESNLAMISTAGCLPIIVRKPITKKGSPRYSEVWQINVKIFICGEFVRNGNWFDYGRSKNARAPKPGGRFEHNQSSHIGPWHSSERSGI